MVFIFLYSCSFRLTEEQTYVTGKTPHVLIRHVIQMSMVNIPIADACVKPHEAVEESAEVVFFAKAWLTLNIINIRTTIAHIDMRVSQNDLIIK
jgi:hypothetical protein